MRISIIIAATAIAAVCGSAHAATVTVNSVAGLPSATEWGTLPGENRNGGSGAVTTTAPRSGNGSLEITGDRSRTQLGIQYDGARTNLGALADVTGLTFDWRIAGSSTTTLDSDYTPALRLLIQDGNTRKELIWEGAYNGTYGNTLRDTWYTSSVNDRFYITGGSELAGQTIAAWASQLAGATVSGISVGVGSSATAGYRAFADNVTLATTAGSTTYNFEVAAPVPEPATWAMMIGGFGVVGFGLRRRTATTTRLSYGA